MMKEMKGVTFLHSETGTEGGWWAMQEDGFANEDGHWDMRACSTLKKAMTSRFLPTTAAYSCTASFTKIPKLGQFHVR